MVRVYTICYSQSDQCLLYFLFSTVGSGFTSLAVLSSMIGVYTIFHSFYTVLSRTTLFAILSSLNSIYTTCHSQQSDQCLHYFPFFLCSIIKVYTVCHTQQSDQGLHYQQSDQGLHFLQFSAVRTVSTLFAILSLIRVNTVYLSQQSGQDLHYLPFSALWSRSRCTLSFPGTVRSGSILYAILCSLIRVCTICHSQYYGRSLHYLPF